MVLQEQGFLTGFEKWLKVRWDGFVVHYHEIGLKKGNRRSFVKALCHNLRRALRRFGAEVQDLFDRIFVTVSEENFAEALFAASKVFGVAYSAPIKILPRSVEAMMEAAIQTYKSLALSAETFAVRVRRIDKSFPMTSCDLERTIGQKIALATGAPVDLSNPEVLISFRVYPDCVYQVGPKVQGVGGLPVGVTGKVLALVSGGIDSVIASWLMMRRGCVLDFVHFHAFPNNDEVASEKVLKLVQMLVEPQGLSARLFLVPYYPFQLALLTSKVPSRLELVLFRRFMFKVANKIALESGCKALVTGDNLGQVASQTLENLAVLDDASKLPIFRPLLTFDKQEIIALAQRIGTYELSIQPYKDCCSLISRHPETRAKLREVLDAEKSLPIEQLIERSFSEMKVLTIVSHEI